MREMEYKCDKDILEGEERPGEKQVVVASVLHLFVSLIVLVKAGCFFFLSEITAVQQQVRKPLNYSLLSNPVRQHGIATGCEEDTPNTLHYISAATFTSLGSSTIGCQMETGRRVRVKRELMKNTFGERHFKELQPNLESQQCFSSFTTAKQIHNNNFKSIHHTVCLVAVTKYDLKCVHH